MNRINTEMASKITRLCPASCRYLCKKGVLGTEVKEGKRAFLFYSPYKIAQFLGITREDMDWLIERYSDGQAS